MTSYSCHFFFFWFVCFCGFFFFRKTESLNFDFQLHAGIENEFSSGHKGNLWKVNCRKENLEKMKHLILVHQGYAETSLYKMK